jgi:hypothetical protein
MWLLTLVSFSSVGLWAQAVAGAGAVTGIVLQSDVDGMPDADVVLLNDALGIQTHLLTTDDGLFSMTSVAPATGYHLKVARKGYSTWESQEFAVSTGQTVKFRVALQPDNTERKVDSTGESMLMDHDHDGTTETVSAAEVQSLPTDSRRIDAFIPLAPAATIADTRPGLNVTRSRPFSNIVLTDGVLASNSYFLLPPPGARDVSQDALETVEVLSSGFSVEFGRSIGGIANTSTRIGGRSYHGSLYDYYRPTGLASDDKFAAGFDVRQKLNQGGADFGGPIWGDKVFFFANFEGLSRSGQGINRITNPLIANSTGTAVQLSNCSATAAQCAAAAKFLQSQMNVTEPLWEHSQSGFGKIDYRRSDTNSFNFEYNGMHWKSPALAQTAAVAPNGGLIGDPILTQDDRFAKAGWTSALTPYTVNDLRFGWYENRMVQDPVLANLSTGLTGINIAGTTVGQIQPYTVTLPDEHRFQIVENLHQAVNSHLFVAGGDLSDTHDSLVSLANQAGLYTYPSLTAFAQDFSGGTAKNYTSFQQTVGTAARNLTTKELNVYVADRWKATDRLTLTLGLRYEKPVLPQPSTVNTGYYNTATIPAPGLDLAPRASFAYLVDDRTVIRGGYGFYYAPYAGQLLDSLFLGNGIYQTNISVNSNQPNAPVFPNIVTASSLPAGTSNLAYVNGKGRNPLTHEGTVEVERYIGRDSSFTVGYIDTRGYKLWTATDVNLAPPAKAETYAVDNTAGQQVSTYATSYWTVKNDGNYAHIWSVTNGGSFLYRGVTAQWRSRLPHGLGLWATYTWSHATDNLSVDSATGFTLAGSTTGDFNADRGRSAFDQRQRATVRWTWQPLLAASGSALAKLVNGWGFSGIGTFGSSQGVTPIVMVQGQQFSGATMAYTSSLNGSGGWARDPFSAIGSLPIPAQYNVDVRVARSLDFSERIKATVSFQAFNLFNRQAATLVNTISYLSVAPLQNGLANGPYTGILKPVSGLGTGIASQGYPDGTNARRSELEFRVTF